MENVVEMTLEEELAGALKEVRGKVVPADLLRCALKSGIGISTVGRYMNGNVKEIRSTDTAVKLLNYMNACAAIQARCEDDKNNVAWSNEASRRPSSRGEGEVE